MTGRKEVGKKAISGKEYESMRTENVVKLYKETVLDRLPAEEDRVNAPPCEKARK